MNKQALGYLPRPTSLLGPGATAPVALAHWALHRPLPRPFPLGACANRLAPILSPWAASIHSYLGSGSGMIGQKTLYSFFSPTPTGKRRVCSPEPAHPRAGVAAVAEENSDVTVRHGGDCFGSWGQEKGRQVTYLVLRVREWRGLAWFRGCKSTPLTQ